MLPLGIFAVNDAGSAPLVSATGDLSRTLGLTWSPVRDGQLGHWDYRIVFSTQGPPFFEVIQGPVGSPWDATAGSPMDHIGYWSSDLNADKRRLVERGAPMEFDLCPYGRSFTYHRLDSLGVRIELSTLQCRPDSSTPGAPARRPCRPSTCPWKGRREPRSCTPTRRRSVTPCSWTSSPGSTVTAASRNRILWSHRGRECHVA